MSERDFFELWAGKQRQGKLLSPSLDPVYDRIPAFIRAQSDSEGQAVVDFLKPIVRRIAELAGMIKLNPRHFRRIPDGRGLFWTQKLVQYIRHLDPLMPVCWDLKGGDIDASNWGDIYAAFEFIGADAITLYPNMGKPALKPFLEQRNKGLFFLCRTTGGSELETVQTLVTAEEGKRWGTPCALDFSGRGTRYNFHPIRLYERVAYTVTHDWNDYGNCCLTASALDIPSLARIRQIAGVTPLLIQGGGEQGGAVNPAVQAAKDRYGHGFVITSSRPILYAYEREEMDQTRFAEAAEMAARRLHLQIQSALAGAVPTS